MQGISYISSIELISPRTEFGTVNVPTAVVDLLNVYGTGVVSKRMCFVTDGDSVVAIGLTFEPLFRDDTIFLIILIGWVDVFEFFLDATAKDIVVTSNQLWTVKFSSLFFNILRRSQIIHTAIHINDDITMIL